jgi:signal transduction histidine kinase
MVPTPAELRTIRALLATACIAVPAFGVLRQLEDPSAHIGWGVRWAFSGAALALWVASLRSGWLHDRLRPVAILFVCALQAWYVHSGGADGMSEGQAISTMLISALATLLFRDLLEMLAFAVFTAIMLAHAYRDVASPAISLPLFCLTLVTVVGSIGLISQSRRRLDMELEEARRTLERRVEERTAALASEVEERRAAERAAREASQAKSTFLANMSHELRTPLNAILGYTELVLEELDESSRSAVEPDLGRVSVSARHLLRLIDDVLDLTRVESGKLEVRSEPTDVAALVAEVLLEGAPGLPTATP